MNDDTTATPHYTFAEPWDLRTGRWPPFPSFPYGGTYDSYPPRSWGWRRTGDDDHYDRLGDRFLEELPDGPQHQRRWLHRAILAVRPDCVAVAQRGKFWTVQIANGTYSSPVWIDENSFQAVAHWLTEVAKDMRECGCSFDNRSKGGHDALVSCERAAREAERALNSLQDRLAELLEQAHHAASDAMRANREALDTIRKLLRSRTEGTTP